MRCRVERPDGGAPRLTQHIPQQPARKSASRIPPLFCCRQTGRATILVRVQFRGSVRRAAPTDARDQVLRPRIGPRSAQRGAARLPRPDRLKLGIVAPGRLARAVKDTVFAKPIACARPRRFRGQVNGLDAGRSPDSAPAPNLREPVQRLPFVLLVSATPFALHFHSWFDERPPPPCRFACCAVATVLAA